MTNGDSPPLEIFRMKTRLITAINMCNWFELIRPDEKEVEIRRAIMEKKLELLEEKHPENKNMSKM